MIPIEVEERLLKLAADQDFGYLNEIVAVTKDELSRLRGSVEIGQANRAWFLFTIATCLADYIASFEEVRTGDCYKAWCAFERIEISIGDLKRNPVVESLACLVEKLSIIVSSWQNLFPYAVFFSPEIIIKRETCSVCGLDVSPWDDCGHRRGYVYSGVLCHSNVEEMEFRGISIVSDPVQKFSVAFASDGDGNRVDQYDYSTVKFVAERLVSPLDRWEACWTEAYHSHSLYAENDLSDPCPCGSGMRYKSCCREKPGVRRPHLQVRFERTREGFPAAELGGYGDNVRNNAKT